MTWPFHLMRPTGGLGAVTVAPEMLSTPFRRSRPVVLRQRFLVSVFLAALIAVLLVVPTVDAQPCCEEHGGTGCGVLTCAECVCDVDPACCADTWDLFCVAAARDDCETSCLCDEAPTPTPTPGGDCCAPHAGGGCDEATCASCVCGVDEQCCAGEWDASCAHLTLSTCAASCDCSAPTPSPTPLLSDCCAERDGTGCEDATCAACVCGVDPICCSEQWDATCADEAALNCASVCACPAPGACCEAHDGVSCEEVRCKSCVCALDAFCCTDAWDQTCVEVAIDGCPLDCSCEAEGDCCTAHGGIGCDVLACQDCVCAQDPVCCDEWDAQCATVAALVCGAACPACVPTDCCEAREEPGCNQDVCEACVCNVDPFCCDELWDEGCLAIATGDCPAECGCRPPCPGDCSGDGEVTVNDLILAVNIALGARAVVECEAIDTNGDGAVTVNELIQGVNAALNGC